MSPCSLEADLSRLELEAARLLRVARTLKHHWTPDDLKFCCDQITAAYADLKRLYEEDGLLEKLKNPEPWLIRNLLKP